MVDALTIGGALSSLKTAADIAKALLGLRDEMQIRNKVIELQSAILSAQSDALQSQAEQNNLLHRVRELEAENAQLKSNLSTKPKVPEARMCPLCNNEMRVTKETDDDIFGVMGIKVHHMECNSCKHKTARQYQPGKGYL